MNRVMQQVYSWMGWRTRGEDDREYCRRMLSNEAELSKGLRDFMFDAVNRGREAVIFIEVDGIRCSTGILLSAKEPLMEHIANWAARERIVKQQRLEDFDKIMDRLQGKEVDRIMSRMRDSDG